MNRKTVVALLGALVIALMAAGTALAGSTGPAVTVQIKTMSKTLKTAVVQGQTGWITKGGTPRGKCSAGKAAGALGEATHGRWTGTYSASVGGIFITSILGVKPTGSDYWSIYVNGRSASKGICDIALHKGERLLFKIVKG
ncbi:MAG: DUF4430 domain-containing protein [Solirubrobacteraceae bacterium]